MSSRRVNIEKELFKSINEEENNSIVIFNDYLNTSDFKFSKLENDGDSGNLLLAISKKDSSLKYIVKHEYYDSACNEYMFSKIAHSVGVLTPDVKLFIVDDKKNLFKSNFVCGIRYLENSKLMKEKDLISNKRYIEEYIKMIALGYILDEGDGVEVIEYNNDIYRIDATSSFKLSHLFIQPIAYINCREDIKKNSEKFLHKLSSSFGSREFLWNYSLKNISDLFGEKYISSYIDVFKKVLQIDSLESEKWISNLVYIYPNIVGDYYRNYIYNLKNDLGSYLNSLDEKVKVKRY